VPGSPYVAALNGASAVTRAAPASRAGFAPL